MKISTHLKKLKPRTLIYIAGLVMATTLLHGCGEGTLPPPAPPDTGAVVITGAAA